MIYIIRMSEISVCVICWTICDMKQPQLIGVVYTVCMMKLTLKSILYICRSQCSYYVLTCCLRSRVYEMVRCPSLSVCLSQHGPTAANRNPLLQLLCIARRTGDIDRLLQQQRANAGSVTLSAYVGS